MHQETKPLCKDNLVIRTHTLSLTEFPKKKKFQHFHKFFIACMGIS